MTSPLSASEWRPHLRRAVELLDGQAALARAISVAQPTVWEWLHKRRTPLRVEFVLRIEEATKEQVKRHQLRPDVFTPAEEAAA